MFGSDVLDVAIGLVLVFLMMSIIMTAVQEALEGIFKRRATDLETALLQLMQDDAGMLTKFYEHPLIFALYKGRDAQGAGKGPTYIPREAFSAALVDLIEQPDSPAPKELLTAYEGLKRLAVQRGVDPGKLDERRLRKEIEGWYDAAMDRASGWFKRRTQRNLFLMGLAAAIVLNINAVSIAQFLNANRAEREHLIGIAQGKVAAAKAATEQAKTAGSSPSPGAGSTTSAAGDAAGDAAASVDTSGSKPPAPAAPAAASGESPAAGNGIAGVDEKQFEQQLYGAGLPFGWSAPSRRWTLREFNIAREDKDLSAGQQQLAYAMAGLGLVVGYLMTALAVMLGAPFWFDILNRLMVVRSTVKPKEKSPDEPSVDR